ncbi:MAG: conjugative transfer system coupling protein TraD [Candidatus Thiodiazotropha endolucinida]|nr:conjugative transfer system coupling protein TraD [Candidatus Thiodiazotropha taylori]MCW4248527.1 conjugative transfer system coupling protein TraD [Candidatus Thiodiazotropha endolucinida]MCG7881917.1 conjugative transfer system coupling protein TraD [Candidatus Thiodiazotropha taylori]MCG7952926.1 conjugative transfer system coupling protein TraD [Candidatus Thiodiazotropha taylori]MCG8058664.1 conjugative transfer system coupling protein TraD [Candidatus Thiodiazotropha taylori]
MKYDSMAYENPWRPNYESHAAGAWVMAATVALGVNQMTNLPPEPFYWMGGICGVMAMARLPQAVRLATLQKHLRGRPLEFIKLKQLTKNMAKKPDALWLGHGFMWENRHAQRVFEILKRDWSEIVNNSSKRTTGKQMGQTWIHGVEPKEQRMYQALSHSEGQNLIVGTTGAGKTRMFDLLISQAIMRNEAVIIIDPKGDKEMRENARRACEAAGHPDRFVQFHPAFPDESARIDPLRNFTRVTEIASRLAALIPSEAGADPFKSFGWQALNNISQALVMAYERPNLVLLKRFLESGPQQMVVKATIAYAERNIDGGRELATRYLTDSSASSTDKKARAMSKFYEEVIQPQAPSPELEGLISMFHHDKTHFSKMVANLLPIMNMLTAGELGKLLSPDYRDVNDSRLITDNKKIIDNAQVAYIGLDSLTDSTVGSAIGSIILSDLVAVAGDRYNFGVGNRPVNIFVDEASEVINEPTIQLLNKGRGALMKMFIATQTIADFEARLGSKERARQVLGNLNNIYAMRVIDPETQEFITENLPKTRLKHVMRTQGMSSQSESPMMFSANTGERLMEEEGDLFPSQLLGMLPNLEYIAKISGGMIVKGRLPILTG